MPLGPLRSFLHRDFLIELVAKRFIGDASLVFVGFCGSVGKLSLVRWFPVDVFGMYVIWSRFTRAVIKLECCGDFDTERHVPLLRTDFLSSVENTRMYDNVYPIDDAINDRYCFVENLKRIGKSHIRVCRRE